MLKYFGGAPIMIDCGPDTNLKEAYDSLEKKAKAEEQRDPEKDDKSQKEDA